MTEIKLALVGVGKLGKDCGEVLGQYHALTGYDLVETGTKQFQMAPNLAAAVRGARFIFIAVPTPHDPAYGGEKPTSHLEPKDFDYGPLQQVAVALRPLTDVGQTVVVISTVLPGTIRKVIAPELPGVRLIYNPYLIAMGSVEHDMRFPEMIIMGSSSGAEDGDIKELLDVYRPILRNDPRLVIGTWEEAEAVKIFYNTFISAKLSLVNMVLDVAEKCGNINVDVVTAALRDSTERIMGPRYMHAGMGDAGACHPRDNIALRALAQNLELGYDLFEAIMSSRERQAENMARKLHELHVKYQLPVVILGKAYKPRVSYTDGSYSLLVSHYLQTLGVQVEFVDPLTGDQRASKGPAIFLLAHNQGVTYARAGVPYDNDAGFYCDIPRDSVILDPWRTCNPIPSVRIVYYGNTRRNENLL